MEADPRGIGSLEGHRALDGHAGDRQQRRRNQGDDGKVTNYAFSGGAPGQLMRRGIMKSAIQVGSTVTVDGFKAKDGSNNAFGSKVTYPDGRMVFTANQEDQNKR